MNYYCFVKLSPYVIVNNHERKYSMEGGSNARQLTWHEAFDIICK